MNDDALEGRESTVKNHWPVCTVHTKHKTTAECIIQLLRAWHVGETTVHWRDPGHSSEGGVQTWTILP